MSIRQAAASWPVQELTVVSSPAGAATNYEVEVTQGITLQNAPSGNAGVSGTTASGSMSSGVEHSYTFQGEIVDFNLDLYNAAIYVNGLLVQDDYPNIITFRDGVDDEYRLVTSGHVAPYNEVDPEEDRMKWDQSTAEGITANHWDTWQYSGTVTNIIAEGVTVVDHFGNETDPTLFAGGDGSVSLDADATGSFEQGGEITVTATEAADGQYIGDTVWLIVGAADRSRFFSVDGPDYQHGELTFEDTVAIPSNFSGDVIAATTRGTTTGEAESAFLNGSGEQVVVGNVPEPEPPEPPNEAPSASFGFGPATPIVGEQVTFDASASSDPDGSIAEYMWNIGGVSASGQTTAHSFGSAGDYTITLTVTDGDDASDTTMQSITVDPDPDDDNGDNGDGDNGDGDNGDGDNGDGDNGDGDNGDGDNGDGEDGRFANQWVVAAVAAASAGAGALLDVEEGRP